MGWSNAGWLGDDSGWYLNKVASGGSTTTWNPADKNASITLSGGNLTASGTSASRAALRAIASHSTGKFYYEVVVSASPNIANTNAGIATAAANLATYISVDTTGVAYFEPVIFFNNGVIASIQSAALGDTICIAVDLGAQFIWVRTNGGNWNNDPAANPATGTNGTSFAGIAAGPYFPAATLDSTTDVMTANFGATAYAQTVPSGFGNW